MEDGITLTDHNVAVITNALRHHAEKCEELASADIPQRLALHLLTTAADAQVLADLLDAADNVTLEGVDEDDDGSDTQDDLPF